MVLAACCAGHVMGDRTRDLENTLALYRATFAVWDRQNTPVDWALAQLNLAGSILVYAGMEPGLAAQSRQHAQGALDASLQVTARATDPL